MQEEVRPEAARSIAHNPLPPAPADAAGQTSLVLFYQYVEPPWTPKEHKHALKTVIALGEKCAIKGRGRCAAEGLNCTLTGPPEALRRFCNGLREWQPALFNETDFKFTDGLAAEHAFKALTIQKKDDLVAYGLPTEVAPVLQTSTARHVEADEYHELMCQPDSVIIDVRNAYESAIGHFAPPEGGAQLIDPKLRNSIEFPKWLNAPETQARLQGKRVLMYCTGGIRCERASALLDAMARTSNGAFAVEDTVMVRGGIERYMKTFPDGGYWKGKNYLFDRRLEQVPEKKSEAALEADVESCCCVCHQKCGYYRGQYVCAGWLPSTASKCGVPVIVCGACAQSGVEPSQLFCPLCEEGYTAPAAKPDLSKLQQEMRAKSAAADGADGDASASVSALRGAPYEGGGGVGAPRVGTKRARQEARAATLRPSARLFVANLPLVLTATELRAALLASLRGEAPPPKDGTKAAKKWRRAQRIALRNEPRAWYGGGGGGGGGKQEPAETTEPFGAAAVAAVRWLADRSSGGFYGSAHVEMCSVEAAKALVVAAATSELRSDGGVTTLEGGVRLKGRRLRVHFAQPLKPGDAIGVEREFPPVIGAL
jgi:predicted sulfurtransferase